MNDYSSERQTALDAIRAAASITSRIQQTLLDDHTLTKDDRSPVTMADFGAQAIVGHLLQRDFPDDPLIGEESSDMLRQEQHRPLAEKTLEAVRTVRPDTDFDQMVAWIDHGGGDSGERFWTLDPVDGTKGFIRGEQYAIALALIEAGEVVLGVLACPNLPPERLGGTETPGTVFHATRHQGAFAGRLDGGEEGSLLVWPGTDPAVMSFCESVESGHSSHDRSKAISQLLGNTGD
ncbi:MAG: inositol monophosphatase family protein, partial [Verrucomicrobiota bacterium]